MNKLDRATNHTLKLSHLIHLRGVSGVYSISCPVTNTVVYIGLSCNVFTRFKSHINAYDHKTPVGKWMNECKQTGIVPIFELLQELPFEKVGFKSRTGRKAELKWIKHFKSKGLAELNVYMYPVRDFKVK